LSYEADVIAYLDQSAAAIRGVIGGPFEWCYVPAGPFGFGSKNEQVDLPAFAIAKYLITYNQYKAFLEAADGFLDKRWLSPWADSFKDANQPYWKLDDCPMDRVNWHDALAFCRWISWKLDAPDDPGHINDWAMRLPTEYEWEKAARGTDGRLYPWGDDFDEARCNTEESAIGQPTPVLQYPQGASPYGTFDMCGNVWEWCLTDHKKPVIDANDVDLYGYHWREIRGGAFPYDSSKGRTTERYNMDPKYRDYQLGFRVCCLLPT
jgi:formylglycine-generating enzyme required for sulfatase activity